MTHWLLLLLVAAILAFAIYWRRRGRKKALIPWDIRRRIRKELSRIRRAKLSGAEEAIALYQVFQMIMHAALTPRPPHLPAAEYAQTLVYLYPHLEAQTRTITRIFSEAMYGKAEPPAESVREVRLAVVAIFTYFS